MESMLEKMIHRGLMALVFLLPLFFLPLTMDFFDFNKNFLLILAVLILTLLWVLKMALEKRILFKKTVLDLPVLLIAISYLLSFFFASTNKVEAFFLPLNLGTILALTLFYFLMTNNLSLTKIVSLFHCLIASASLLALIALYQVLGVPQTLIAEKSGFAFLRSITFSPTGGLLSLGVFLSLNLLLLLILFYKKLQADQVAKISAETTIAAPKSKRDLFFFLYLFSGFLLIFGLGVTLFQLLTTNRPVFLPLFSGWVIALEAFKNFPFLGVGVENFAAAFSIGKPLSYNATSLWNSRFGVSSNFYFHWLTTVGLLGFLAWLWLIFQVIKNYSLQKESGYVLLAVFLLFAFFPPGFLLLFLTYLLLALLSAGSNPKIIERSSNRAVNALLILVILFNLAGVYGLGRVLTGEILFRNSLVAASENKGGLTYDLQVRAINLNPAFDTYRSSFSQINLALAGNLSAKKDLADADKANINQLITQAINEGKNAIALSPKRVGNWENLAAIYQALIQSAKDADQWALASYQQAITLDPFNPVLRVNLGGLYFGAKNYEMAIQQFQAAINLKADYANAHYNLAQSLKAKELWAEAVTELEQTRMLVAFDSNDYKNINKELDELRLKLPKTEESAGALETLTSPASESAKINQPVELPKNAAPVIPSPTPSPKASPTTNPTASPSATPNL